MRELTLDNSGCHKAWKTLWMLVALDNAIGARSNLITLVLRWALKDMLDADGAVVCHGPWVLENALDASNAVGCHGRLGLKSMLVM